MSVAVPPYERLARLHAAAEAAQLIGLVEDAAATAEVVERIGTRAGFGGSVYVMALAGGTGVGKSSILNALAGRSVSEASPLRPTTDHPVAWVALDRRAELAPLLEWLEVGEVVAHEGTELDDVAILDLPDVDSVRPEHRAMVDALLPRIDAVTWVVDPEKYDDARAHAYWRTLVPHADRLQFVLNKADRLTDAERAAVVEDLRLRLVADGIERPIIRVTSALTGEGIDDLRSILARAAAAKAIVARKLEADRAQAARSLARAVGLDPAVGHRSLLDGREREALVGEAIDGAVSLVDPDGLADQVRGAVLYQARAGGGSLLGRVVALVGNLSGQRRRRADPAAYLRGWRERGAMGRVLNPVRRAMVEAAEGVPAPSRGPILESLGAPTAEADLMRTLDRTVASEASALEIPRSPLWSVIGVLQLIVGAVLVFALAWIVVLFVAGGGVPVATVDAPLLGPIPMPLALLAGAVLVSALLGWVLGLHAGSVGRRVAGRVRERVEAAVREAIERDAFIGLRRVEEARRAIASALTAAGEEPARRGSVPSSDRSRG